jgi:hypothetical protein
LIVSGLDIAYLTAVELELGGSGPGIVSQGTLDIVHVQVILLGIAEMAIFINSLTLQHYLYN